MSMRINVRNFTGTTIPLDVDPKHTISEVKDLLIAAASGKGKSIRAPALAFKGHELRDTREILYYDIASNDTIYICESVPVFNNVLNLNETRPVPPSTGKVEKITLNFVLKADGTSFSLSINSDITIGQLKREIFIEKKVDANQLKVVSIQEDLDGDEVVTLKDLKDCAVLSALLLEDNVIFLYSKCTSTLLL
jgi:hypothetical protein